MKQLTCSGGRINEKRHRDAIQGKKQEEQVWWRPRPRSDQSCSPFLLGLCGMDVGFVFEGKGVLVEMIIKLNQRIVKGGFGDVLCWFLFEFDVKNNWMSK